MRDVLWEKKHTVRRRFSKTIHRQLDAGAKHTLCELKTSWTWSRGDARASLKEQLKWHDTGSRKLCMVCELEVSEVARNELSCLHRALDVERQWYREREEDERRYRSRRR